MDDKYIKIAINEAKKAYLDGEIPVGAVIVRNGVVLSKEHNRKEKKKSVTRHAEIIAIEKASSKINDWRLDGATIYTTLFPCPMCASAIQQARICKLIYINDSNNVAATDISKRILNDTNLNHSVEIIKYSIEDDILNKFFKKIRSNVSRETLE